MLTLRQAPILLVQVLREATLLLILIVRRMLIFFEQTNHGEILPPPGMTDTEFNEAIITATENYMQNMTNNPLNYDAGAGTLPGSMGDGYNSNSFIGSLLRHLGAQLPAGFDSSMFPGWDVDIPPGEL
ncbi:MAG: hypothetical protein ACFE0O_15770 [Opitutales bacterium]